MINLRLGKYISGNSDIHVTIPKSNMRTYMQPHEKKKNNESQAKDRIRDFETITFSQSRSDLLLLKEFASFPE